MAVISADGHIDVGYVPTDLFTKGAPATLKDRMPDLTRLSPVGRKRPSGPNYDRMAEMGYFDDIDAGKMRPGVPELRVEDQEKDGLVGEVVYGILGADRLFNGDSEALRWGFRAYAEWAAEFCNAKPGRFAAISPLTPRDPEGAAEDLRFAAGLGIKGVELKPSEAIKPFWDACWEPLWHAAEDTGTILHFHSDIGILLKAIPETEAEYARTRQALIGSMGKMANSQYLGTLILSGVLERHPGVRLVMGESDISWIPHFLNRMDYMVTEREHSTGLPMLPSEYWHRQCYATFQNDKLGMELIKHLGADNIMWGNDYPHPDGTWPISQQVIADTMSGLSESDRKKVTHDNVAKLYGFQG